SYIKSNDDRLRVSLSEKKSTYKGINRNRQTLIVYHVDGGITTDNSARCDYAVYTKQTDHLYLIELKGSDYPHALEQLTGLYRQLAERGIREWRLLSDYPFQGARTQYSIDTRDQVEKTIAPIKRFV
ncbi:MAG: hypothetical protein LBT83_08535, partial [Tannerella sp.]|nr:hypothetical protein [Tannerella sp.]